MKLLPMIFLLCFVACCKDNHKKNRMAGIPMVTVDENPNPSIVNPVIGTTSSGGTTSGSSSAGATTGGSATGGELTSGGATSGGTSTGGDSTSGGTSTGGDSTSGGTSTGGDSTSGGSTTGTPVETVDEDVIPADADVVKCDFARNSEKETFIMNIVSDGSNRYAVLSTENIKEKAIFGGFILSPSGNEHAAVRNVDKDFSIPEGKVVKITARIVFNTHTGEGELQLSYTVKEKKGKVSVTEYEPLAEISNCAEI